MKTLLQKILPAILSTTLIASSNLAYAAPVNVNQADAKTIAASLKGIGMTKARALVDYREKHGKFTSAESLTQVSGIGIKTVEKNKDDIQL